MLLKIRPARPDFILALLFFFPNINCITLSFPSLQNELGSLFNVNLCDWWSISKLWKPNKGKMRTWNIQLCFPKWLNMYIVALAFEKHAERYLCISMYESICMCVHTHACASSQHVGGNGSRKWNRGFWSISVDFFFFLFLKKYGVKELTMWKKKPSSLVGRLHESIPRCRSALVKQIKLPHQYVSHFM